MCFTRREGTQSVLEQELRAIATGLEAAKQLGLRKVAIASDAQLAMNIIIGKKKEPSCLINLVRKIRNTCNSIP